MPVWYRRWTTFLQAPVDPASLAVFRTVFGAAVAIDAWRFLAYGWVDTYYIQPQIHFTYPLFGFVRPWPGSLMHAHFWLMSAAALLVSAGLFYRVASVVLFLAYTYVFLLEQAVYMNHYYLIVLLAFLLSWMPAERAYSLDRLRRPDIPESVPRWTILTLRFQLFVVYFYGAIAKLNGDWPRGEPMYSAILRHDPKVPEIAHQFPPALLAYVIAYGGLFIDLAVPVLLCFPRARLTGFGLAIVFHALNAIFLRIGIFSYLMVGAITIFFDPDWPRRFVRPMRGFLRQHERRVFRQSPGSFGSRAALGLVALHVYALLQLLIPLRHHLYPGPVSWTEEGHRFSWHMKLREKRSRMSIRVTDPTSGRSWTIDPERDLTDRQLRKLHTFPDMLLQYVHYHRDRLRERGIDDPIITVDWRCSLNGRPFRPLIDPNVNLAAVERSWRPAAWILPLDPAD
jgi:hypothetical protein